jgi:hypothetical protein
VGKARQGLPALIIVLLMVPAPAAPPQVYDANRYSSSPKGRWLAHGVDILLHQYP